MWHLRSRKNQIFQLYQLYVFCHVWRWQKSETETKFACLHAEWYMRQNNALHGINSRCTEKFRNNFPTSVAFFDPQMHPDATYAFRFLMLHDLAKTKILSANKSRDVERYVCRTTALHPPTVTFNSRYRDKVSVGWTPSGYIHRLRDPTAFPL